MALSLYRRHRRDCKASHSEDSRSTDLDERTRGWKRCECAIVIVGTLNKAFRRVSTGRWEWDDARAIANGFEAAGNWAGVKSIAPVAPEPETSKRRVQIEHATKVFMDELKETAAIATQKKYRLMSTHLKDFASSRGYIMLDQIETEDIRAFRST